MWPIISCFLKRPKCYKYCKDHCQRNNVVKVTYSQLRQNRIVLRRCLKIISDGAEHRWQDRKKRWEKVIKTLKNAITTLTYRMWHSARYIWSNSAMFVSANWPNRLFGKAQRHWSNWCTIIIQNCFSLNVIAKVFYSKKRQENKKTLKYETRIKKT